MPNDTPVSGFGQLSQQPWDQRSKRYLGTDWEIIETRSGGMGEVYICSSLRRNEEAPDLKVAFKTFAARYGFSPATYHAFFRECVAWLRLSMAQVPCVLPLIGLYEFDGRPYLGMPAVPPGPDGVVTLRDKLNLTRPTLPDALLAGWCIAHAMARGRAVMPGLVHGDLKPENVLMLFGVPHVADFGLAQFQADLLHSATVLGTPPYSAPELRAARVVASERTDIYSLGIMLVEMLTGNTDQSASDAWHLTLPLGPEAIWLLQLGQRCASADPELRPGNFAEIASTIEAASTRVGVQLPHPDYVRLGMSHVMTQEQQTDRLAAMLHSFLDLRQYELIVEQVAAVPAESRTASLWTVYGDALSLLDRDVEALDAFTAATGSPGGDSLTATIASRTALSLKRLGHHADAVKILEKALPLAKSSKELLELYTNLASIHYAAKDYQLAFQALFRCLSIDSEHVTTWRLLAQVFRFTNNYGRAIQAARRVIQLAPHDPGNYEEFGDILLDIHEFAAFRDAVQNSIRAGGHPRELLARAIAISEVRSEPAEAEEMRRIVRSNFDEDGIAWVLEDAARRVAEDDWTTDDRGPLPVDPTVHQYQEQSFKRMDPDEKAYLGLRSAGNTMTLASVPVAAKDRSTPFVMRAQTAGGIMLDIYFPQGTDDYFTAFNEILKQVMLKPEEMGVGSMSPTSFVFIRCACTAEIITNRPPGKSIICRRCDNGFLVSGSDPSMAELVDQVNIRMGLNKRDADYLVMFVIELEADQPAAAIGQTAIEQGWTPLDPARYAARVAAGLARSHGFLRQGFTYHYFARRVDSMWANDVLTHESVYDLRESISKVPGSMQEGRPGDGGAGLGHSLRTMGINFDLRVSTVHGLLALGELEAAERTLIEHGSQPSDAETWSTLARDALAAGLNDLAIRTARFSVQLAPSAVVPWATLAMVLERQGKTEVGHRCYLSSGICLSRLPSLSFFLRFAGFCLGWCPAGAGVVAGRAVPALAELAHLLLAGGDDPVPAPGGAAGGDPAAVDPVVDAGGGHAELGGQSRDGPLAWVQVREDGGQALGILADGVLADDVADLLAGEDRGALGRPVSRGVERAGDLPAVASLAGEPGDGLQEGRVVGELVQAADRADGSPAGPVPAGPGDVHVHDLAVALDGHGDVVGKNAEQLLAVSPRGRRGVPDPREVGGQGPDRVPLGGGQHCGRLLGEPLVLGL